MNIVNHDESIARSIQDQINCIGITENAIFPVQKEKENYRPRTLIDESLEYIDPTPNIYTLFVQFNKRFFWNALLPVQVKWSPRMTSCAGICTFHPRNKECIISLSSPLLKLRPRKDLIETLLHEMIHAYLFLTNNNRDRDGHGPVFKSHMNRINVEAGTNITIYHTFHEEVRLYQQHWWRCNGPCHNRAPFFGTVRRAMNRVPGPNDFWWSDHQRTCGGQFIKIKEPKKTEGQKKNKRAAQTTVKNNIFNWVKKIDKNEDKPSERTISKVYNTPKITDLKNVNNNLGSNIQTDIKKLGNNTNNVHGWGTGGPCSTDDNYSNSIISNKINSGNLLKNTNSRISFSGVLGGNGSGKSILLDKFSNTSATKTLLKNTNVQSNLNEISLFKNCEKNSNIQKQYAEKGEDAVVTCPNCNKSVNESKINHHLDNCLENSKSLQIIQNSTNKEKMHKNDFTSNKIFKNENKSNSVKIQCPLCPMKVESNNFNEHLSNCFRTDTDDTISDESIHNSSYSSITSNKNTSNNLLNNNKAAPSSTDTLQHIDSGKSIALNKRCDTFTAGASSKNSSLTRSTINNNHDKSAKDSMSNQDLFDFIIRVTCPNCNKSVDEPKINHHLDICLATSENQEMSGGSCNKKRKNEDNYTSKKMFKNKTKSTLRENVEKPTHNKSIDEANSTLNTSNNSHICIVCDKLLEPTKSLSDHLEECVASIFNDFGNDDTIASTNDENQVLEHFPCPVCMALIEATLMNDHLDVCLNKIE
ncbi:PREDICTED: sprT-like domain-containing protein Spartan [Ceratosolen solmsi marchali]|uniref:Protein with SprT-like domain at the N terminus n=1 Tax=Ceratosolen solmsi marchali TaxID=326594 RepID=A0AAJ6YBK8_9HYME|nr:PREDICTED: sprT-like domain-containing protein Spartan [Ceratosolen solmsi marchali]